MDSWLPRCSGSDGVIILIQGRLLCVVKLVDESSLAGCPKRVSRRCSVYAVSNFDFCRSSAIDVCEKACDKTTAVK